MSRALDLLSLEYLVESGACVEGMPDDRVAACRRYDEAGVDTLLCLVNPYSIPHETVMQPIELMGRRSSRSSARRLRRRRNRERTATRRGTASALSAAAPSAARRGP